MNIHAFTPYGLASVAAAQRAGTPSEIQRDGGRSFHDRLRIRRGGHHCIVVVVQNPRCTPVALSRSIASAF